MHLLPNTQWFFQSVVYEELRTAREATQESQLLSRSAQMLLYPQWYQNWRLYFHEKRANWSAFLDEKDVNQTLATGSSKSLIYQLASLVVAIADCQSHLVEVNQWSTVIDGSSDYLQSIFRKCSPFYKQLLVAPSQMALCNKPSCIGSDGNMTRGWTRKAFCHKFHPSPW